MLFAVLLTSAVSLPVLPSLLRRDVVSNITIPSPITNTGVKVIPDAHHPFKAPGRYDLRGPCPGLNTLANHGYIPRNGIVSVADILNGAQEGFNMDFDLAAGLASFGMLARGNALLDKLSIGGPSPLVPPIPAVDDSPLDGTPGGLATHGRFEGDMSMTRFDFGLGDFVNFQQPLFEELLSFVAKHTTNETVTPVALAEFKVARYNDSMAKNPKFDLTDPRFTTSFGEVGFTLGFFPNSTQGVLTVPVMTSIFKHQRFPENWHRRASRLTIDGVGDTLDPFFANPNATGTNTILPGKKDANGTFVVDPSSGQQCSLYNTVAAKGIPASLFGDAASEQTKANANALFDLVTKLVGQGCPVQTASAPPG